MAGKKDLSGNVLAELCSIIQYNLDRGETEVVEGCLTSVRYTNTTAVNSFQVIAKGDVYEVTARKVGPATKQQLIDAAIEF